ncbi:hypothetical protein PFISCL1PPCAC_23043, partial [Pristionchus fissidentatus]
SARPLVISWDGREGARRVRMDGRRGARTESGRRRLLAGGLRMPVARVAAVSETEVDSGRGGIVGGDDAVRLFHVVTSVFHGFLAADARRQHSHHRDQRPERQQQLQPWLQKCHSCNSLQHHAELVT